MDHFSGDKEPLPLSRVPKPKSSFIPSRWEHRQIVKLAHAIRMGRMKTHSQPATKPRFYQLWEEGGEEEVDTKNRRHQVHIPAPRMQLPGHAESYNPPPEYLPSEQEVSPPPEYLPSDQRQVPRLNISPSDQRQVPRLNISPQIKDKSPA